MRSCLCYEAKTMPSELKKVNYQWPTITSTDIAFNKSSSRFLWDSLLFWQPCTVLLSILVIFLPTLLSFSLGKSQRCTISIPYNIIKSFMSHMFFQKTSVEELSSVAA